MKVIDLLNKIANGEDVPEFIEVTNYFTKENEMLYTHTDNIFHCLDNGELRLNSIISAVEDKEEEKDIETIPYHYNLGYIDCGDLKREVVDELSNNFNYFADKINELIDAVNKLKKEDK